MKSIILTSTKDKLGGKQGAVLNDKRTSRRPETCEKNPGWKWEERHQEEQEEGRAQGGVDSRATAGVDGSPDRLPGAVRPTSSTFLVPLVSLHSVHWAPFPDGPNVPYCFHEQRR